MRYTATAQGLRRTLLEPRRSAIRGSVSTLTYKTPIVKTQRSRSFCLRGRCNDWMMGIGITNSAKSVVTLTPAITYQMVWLLRQCPVPWAGSQKAETGMQTSGSRKQRVIPHADKNTRPARMILFRVVLEKIRRYNNRMDILVRQTAIL